MKPVSRETPDLPAQAPHSLRLPATRRRAQRAGNGVRAVLVGLLVLMVLAIGFVTLSHRAAPPRAVENAQIVGPAVGTIKYLTEGDVCRQATIDNGTGQIAELGRLACEQSRQGHPGGRLGSVRDSFMKR
jgi:hypothetical protein